MSKAVKAVTKILSKTIGGEMFGIGKKEDSSSDVGSVTAPSATPTAVSADTMEARDALRKRQLAAAGLGGTVLTGAGGLSPNASTAGKSLLGS
jgi:hypothetical protein